MNVHHNVVALDCEMVGIARDYIETKSTVRTTLDNALCRVSVVAGSPTLGFSVLLDMWVKVESEVLDFRTTITGIDAESYAGKKQVVFSDARRSVKELIRGRTVVGHATWNDFKVLNLAHPKSQIHDTALDKDLRPPWRRNMLPSLSLLAEYWLREQIHDGIHDSISDATVALKLYHLMLAKKSAAPLGISMTIRGAISCTAPQDASGGQELVIGDHTPPAQCKDDYVESDASTKAEAECSSNSTPSSSSEPSEQSAMRLSVGEKVVAYFYGDWHPGVIRRFKEDKVEILWEAEWSVSLLPISHVRRRSHRNACSEEVFDNDDIVAMPVMELDAESTLRSPASSSSPSLMAPTESLENQPVRRGRWRKNFVTNSESTSTAT